MQIGLNSEELWDSLEIKLINVKNIKGIDPVIIDKVDAIINNYNGGISGGYQSRALGKIETLVKILSSKEYYRTRGIEASMMNKLVELSEDLDLFRKVIINEVNTSKINDTENGNVKLEKLPNLESDKEYNLYKDNGATPKFV